jgi:hypothetical protein
MLFRLAVCSATVRGLLCFAFNKPHEGGQIALAEALPGGGEKNKKGKKCEAIAELNYRELNFHSG